MRQLIQCCSGPTKGPETKSRESNLSPNPRTADTRHAKLCTWHNWFHPFNTSNPYFLLPVSGNRMKRVLCFRTRQDVVDPVFTFVPSQTSLEICLTKGGLYSTPAAA